MVTAEHHSHDYNVKLASTSVDNVNYELIAQFAEIPDVLYIYRDALSPSANIVLMPPQIF